MIKWIGCMAYAFGVYVMLIGYTQADTLEREIVQSRLMSSVDEGQRDWVFNPFNKSERVMATIAEQTKQLRETRDLKREQRIEKKRLKKRERSRMLESDTTYGADKRTIVLPKKKTRVSKKMEANKTTQPIILATEIPIQARKNLKQETHAKEKIKPKPLEKISNSVTPIVVKSTKKKKRSSRVLSANDLRIKKPVGKKKRYKSRQTKTPMLSDRVATQPAEDVDKDIKALELTGIWVYQGKTKALLGQRIVEVGDTVKEATVLSISNTTVTLKSLSTLSVYKIKIRKN